MLRPQDIVVLLELAVSGRPGQRQQDIARAVGLS